MSPLQFLEQLQAEVPDSAGDISELARLYQDKLWHHVTVKVDSIIKSEGPLNSGDVPLRLYQGFVSDLASKINLLKLAQFAVHATRSLAEPSASVAFLQGVVAKVQELKLPRSTEPILFIRMHIAQHYIEMGSLPEAKQLLEQGQEQLQALSSADPSVSAVVFYVHSLLCKAQADYAGFYKNSLMYLSFVASDSLPADFKLRLAVDVSLAALLGDHVYSFGQLLQHPIVHALDASPYAWLHEVLQAFNSGDLSAYDLLCTRYAPQLNTQPALVANERRLREKITLMCLLELVGSLPAEERTISLDTIAQRTKLNIDGVEFLLMKALSLHLLEGSIDQVACTVNVTWLVPRILTKLQLSSLQQRLDGWVSKVTALASSLEEHALGVAA